MIDAFKVRLIAEEIMRTGLVVLRRRTVDLAIIQDTRILHSKNVSGGGCSGGISMILSIFVYRPLGRILPQNHCRASVDCRLFRRVGREMRDLLFIPPVHTGLSRVFGFE